jgi:hypothetical protein
MTETHATAVLYLITFVVLCAAAVLLASLFPSLPWWMRKDQKK